MRRSHLFIWFFIAIFAACSGPVRDSRYSKPARPLPGKEAKKLLKGASTHIGDPYKYGGVTPKGWDCSGFVYGMYKRYLDITLPRSTDVLYSSCIKIKSQNGRPGDLVFFRIDSVRPSHVGIYVGKNKFIHSSTTQGVVISDLRDDYYRKYFAGFRRPRFGIIAINR